MLVLWKLVSCLIINSLPLRIRPDVVLKVTGVREKRHTQGRWYIFIIFKHFKMLNHPTSFRYFFYFTPPTTLDTVVDRPVHRPTHPPRRGPTRCK